MNEVFGSPQAVREAARIIHSLLRTRFPAMTESERDDIEQDVKLKLWRMGAGGKKIDNIKSYLWKAVYTTALDSLDRRWVQLGPEDFSGANGGEVLALSGPPGPEALLEKNETSRALKRAVESLPRRRRAVMELRLLGLDITESAAFLSWSEAKVRHLLYRGMADLKKKMNGNGRAKGAP
jgi:RNA polymerase sigma-70 factor (ECF subfamily)